MVKNRMVSLLVGPALYLVVAHGVSLEGLSPAAAKTLGLALWMAFWWMTESIPIPITALLPIVILPLSGIMTMPETTKSYGNPLIYLFLGGFMLALAMEKSELHRRFALQILGRFSSSAGQLVLGFMVVAATLSMWVTNTATTMMMMPIALSVIEMVRTREKNPAAVTTFATALMLGIAYAASIGGLGTLIGTVPNTILAGFVQANLGIKLSFATWMLVGVPLVICLIPVTWVILTRFLFQSDLGNLREGRTLLRAMTRELGPLRPDELRVFIVFACTASLWVLQPLITKHVFLDFPLTDTGIAIAAAIALFVIPAGPGKGGALLDWASASKLPWDLLLMFGGGLALAESIKSSGLSEWLGQQIAALGFAHPFVLTLLITFMTIVVTEMTSNTATTATFLPVIASIAQGLGIEPLILLVPTAIAASCAFMLPVATPPNAIVYGTGVVTIRDMMRAGIYLNGAATLIIATLCYFVVPWIF